MKARMIPSRPEMALLYRLDESAPEGAEIRRLLSQYQISVRVIPEGSLGQTVAAFSEKEAPVPGDGTPYAGAVMLFSGVEPKKQQAVLRALRDCGAGRSAIKAVVTPSNLSWTFEKLFAELAEEHARMTAQRGPDDHGNGANGAEG